MNKIKGTILLLLTATLYMVAALKGSVGCMDNSQHLRQNFDTKAYHYVQCDCVCRSRVPGTNQCTRCGHINVPQEQEYVSANAKPAVAKAMAVKGYGVTGKADHELDNLMQNPDVKLKQLIAQYRLNRGK